MGGREPVVQAVEAADGLQGLGPGLGQIADHFAAGHFALGPLLQDLAILLLPEDTGDKAD